MNKFKRYLGLVFAFVLMGLAFMPVGPHPYYPNVSKVTPLDNTLLAQLTGTGGRGSRIWLGATDYMNACPPFQKMSKRVLTWQTSDCQGGSGWVFAELPKQYEANLTTFEPAILSLANEYSKALSEWMETRRNVNSSINLSVVPAQTKSIRDPRLAELELQIGTAMAKHLDSKKSALAFSVYAVHFFAALVGFVLVMFRQQVGAVLLWPFSLLLGAAKVGGKTARNLHDKV